MLDEPTSQMLRSVNLLDIPKQVKCVLLPLKLQEFANARQENSAGKEALAAGMNLQHRNHVSCADSTIPLGVIGRHVGKFGKQCWNLYAVGSAPSS